MYNLKYIRYIYIIRISFNLYIIYCMQKQKRENWFGQNTPKKNFSKHKNLSPVAVIQNWCFMIQRQNYIYVQTQSKNDYSIYSSITAICDICTFSQSLEVSDMPEWTVLKKIYITRDCLMRGDSDWIKLVTHDYRWDQRFMWMMLRCGSSNLHSQQMCPTNNGCCLLGHNLYQYIDRFTVLWIYQY